VFLNRSLVLPVGLLVLIIVPQLLFTGTFARLVQLPSWLQWLGYVCNVGYGLKIVQAVEFSQTLCETELVCRQWAGLLAGNFVSEDDVWWYCLVLVLLFVAYRVLAFFIIQRLIWKLR
jgi:hypothetical protein